MRCRGGFLAALSALVLLAAAFPAQAEPTLSLGHTQAEPGQEVVVPLSLAGSATPRVISLSIRIAYSPSWLTFARATQGDLVRAAGAMVLANRVPGSAEDTVAVSVAGTEPLGDRGVLLDLVFRVSAGALRNEEALLRFAPGTRANRGQPRLLTESGSIAVALAGSYPGDFTGDGVVDLADFFAFADHFGTRQGERVYAAPCDLDGNGSVDVEDFFRFADLVGTRY
ncbi:MAG: cohesin domain-containing protein [Candidatus Latescibacterota bacterium]